MHRVMQSTARTGKQMAGQSVQARVCLAIALEMRELHAASEAQFAKTLIEVLGTSQCEGVSQALDVKVNVVCQQPTILLLPPNPRRR